MKKIIELILVAVSLSAVPAHSGAVIFDESISGDVEGFTPFFLDFGLNTFEGGVSIGSVIDFDQILFVLPSASQASFEFDMSYHSVGGLVPFAGFTWYLDELTDLSDPPCGFFCGSDTFAGQSFNANGTVVDVSAMHNFDNLPVLMHDIYALHTTVAGGPTGFDVEMSYLAQIDVRAVPLPPTLVFMLSGLVFLYSTSKKNIT